MIPYDYQDESDDDYDRRKQRRSDKKDSDEERQLANKKQFPGAEWYATLPEPWNEPPEELDRVEKVIDPVKLLSNVNIEKFDGTPGSYVSFRAMFIDMVHSRNLPLKIKNWALRVMLDSKVPKNKEIMSSMFLLKDGYKQAILALEKEYGAKKRTIKEQIDRIRRHPVVKAGDYDQLSSFQKKVTDCISILARHGRARETECESFYYDVYDKLPETYHKRFSDYLQHDRLDDELENLLEWMDQEIRSLKNMRDKRSEKTPKTDSDKNQEYSKPKPKTYVAHSEDNTSDTEEQAEEDNDDNNSGDERVNYGYNQKKKGGNNTPKQGQKEHWTQKEICPICHTQHLLRDCKKFNAKDPVGRRKVIEDAKRCVKCFREGHVAKTCPTNIKCKDCGKAHHTLLHGSKPYHTTINVAQVYDEEGNTSDIERLFSRLKNIRSPVIRRPSSVNEK